MMGDQNNDASHSESAPIRRLIINQMTLHNFKSYYGTQVIGPFHKSFSAVVGPNGSGKSNVIDSLLFVFGYRANKMRQGRLSELIHTSKAHHNNDQCFVEVQFIEIIDSGDSYELVPGSDLIIRRTAYRNNSSNYYLNNKTSSYKEVTSKLRDCGIDLDHKRFLILQGEVESISQMKPKALNEHDEGLLEYLEDIIGTSQYKESIEKAGLELEKVSEERQEKANRLKFVEKERDNLEAKKLEAEAYLRDENTLVQKKHIATQVKKMYSVRAAEEAQENLNNLKKSLKMEEAKFADVVSESKTLEKNVEKINREFEALNQEYDAASKEVEKISKDDILNQENYRHTKTKIKKLVKQLEKDEYKVKEYSKKISNHTEDLEKVQNEHAELEASLAKEDKKLQDIVESMKDRTNHLSQAIEEKRRELAPWNEKMNLKQSQIDVAQSNINLLKGKSEAHSQQLSASKQAVSDLNDEKKEKTSLKSSTIKEQKTLETKIQKEEHKLNQIRSDEESLQNKARETQQKYSEAQSAIQSARSRGTIMDALLRQKELGRLGGIIGRLGSLGVIDSKYDVAISTACPQLNNILVDTMETAQECVKFLRENNLGRASFMALDRIQNSNIRKISTPRNLPRLFDLVEPKDDSYAQAFYSVMRDTLVADNLELAREVGMGAVRWRVVTLQGQLVERTGIMSGGGTRVSRGIMSSQFVDESLSSEAVELLRKEKENADNELKKFRQSFRQAEADLEKNRRQLPQLEIQLSKLDMDLVSLESQIQDGKKRFAQLSETTALTSKEEKSLGVYQDTIVKTNKELESLRKSAKVIEDKIKEFESQILQEGGVQFRTQKNKVENINNQIELSSQGLNKFQVTHNKNLKDLESFEKAVLKTEKEMAKLGEELEAFKANAKKIEELYTTANEKALEINTLRADKETEQEQATSRLEELSESIDKWKSLEVDLKNQIDDSTRHLSDCKKQCKYWHSELSKLVLQPIEVDPDQMEVDGEEFGGAQLKELDEDELDNIDLQKLENEIAASEAKLQNATPNLGVLAEYRRKHNDYLGRKVELDEATSQRDKIRDFYEEQRQMRFTKFMDGFNSISYKLKEMYQMITLGGNAELELVDSLDPFSEGIIFSVMPPKKSWKNISNLSGGEKTLSSLALVFALHHFKPTPLYVMDEIDAALDFRNVSIVANYIKERTRDAQFIIISLRNNMFELADRLVGIYKTHDTTKSVSIDPNAITMH